MQGYAWVPTGRVRLLPDRAVEPSSGSKVIPRRARPGLAGLRPHTELAPAGGQAALGRDSTVGTCDRTEQARSSIPHQLNYFCPPSLRWTLSSSSDICPPPYKPCIYPLTSRLPSPLQAIYSPPPPPEAIYSPHTSHLFTPLQVIYLLPYKPSVHPPRKPPGPYICPTVGPYGMDIRNSQTQ